MSEHKITVDVYAKWGETPPRYRVYLDNHLLTERDFIWPGHQTFIREHILVNLEPGEHKLKIEKVGKHGIIAEKNIVIDGTPGLAEFTTY